MRTAVPTVFTVEEVAKYLRVPDSLVMTELDRGCLKGFKIGGHWRVTHDALLDFMGAFSIADKPMTMKRNVTGGAEDDLGVLDEDFTEEAFRWEDIGRFQHSWPPIKGGRNPNVESYEEGYRTMLEPKAHPMYLVIGYCDRPAVGMVDRRRAVVFLLKGNTQHPLVEFAGANDFASTGLMASLIRKGGSLLPKDSQVPSDYADFAVRAYSDIVVGPNARKCLAVIIHKDDRDNIARHALIRARDKELL